MDRRCCVWDDGVRNDGVRDDGARVMFRDDHGGDDVCDETLHGGMQGGRTKAGSAEPNIAHIAFEG
jgi:hypothetical protein